MGLGHSLATIQKKKTVKVPRGKASEESLEVVPRGNEELKAAERSFVQDGSGTIFKRRRPWTALGVQNKRWGPRMKRTC